MRYLLYSLIIGFYLCSITGALARPNSSVPGPVSELERSRGIVFPLSLVDSDSDSSFYLVLWDLYWNHQETPLDIYVIGQVDEANRVFDTWIGKDIENYRQIHRIHVIDEAMAQDRGLVVKWVRDYGPLFKRNDLGELIALDFKYSYSTPNKFVDHMIDQNLIPASEKVPLVFEGGNFEVDEEKNCFISKRVLTRNQLSDDSQKNRNMITEIFQNSVGCRSVNFISTVPHEQTGHIDTWMKYMGDQTFVVADVSETTIEAQRRFYPQGYDRLLEIKEALQEIHRELTSLGYKIRKVPIMPIYDHKIGIGGGDSKKTTVYMSYTNSLYFNGTLYVPSFRWLRYDYNRDDFPEGTFELFDEIETHAHNALENFPSVTNIVSLSSNEIVKWGGSIHCLTLQIPEQ